MMIKRMLKFALPALLLAAGASVYAEGPVTLSNGTTVAWDEFVSAINGSGNLGTLPDDDPLKIAVTRAQTAKDKADADVTAKKNAWDEAKAALEALTQTKIDELNGEITTAINKLTDDRRDSTNLEGDIKDLNDQIADLEGDIKTANDAITAAQATYDKYEGQLNGMTKKKGTVGWLNDIYTAAEAFETAFDTQTDGTAKMYYRYTIDEDDMDGGEIITMYVSFMENPGDYSGPVSQSGFRALFAKANAEAGTAAGPLNGKTVGVVYVYLGSEYAATVSSGSKILKATTYNGKNGGIIMAAAQAIRSLTEKSDYQVITDQYEDQTLANTIKGYMNTAQTTITKNQRLINGWHQAGNAEWKEGDTEVNGYNEQITTIRGQISTKEGQLKTLKETTLPADWAAVETAKDNYQKQVTDVQNAPDAAEAAYEAAVDTQVAAATTLKSAQTNLSNAEKEAAAEALESYQNVILTGSITATTQVTKAYAGHINANGNVITINLSTEGATLFGTNFKGATLENAIINGQFATGTSANNYSNVAAWRGTNGVYYDADNGSSGTINSIGELAYKYRDLQFFGADIANNKIVKWTDVYNVYNISVYQPNVATPKTFYTNIAASGSTYKFVQAAPNASELNANTLYGSNDKFEFGGEEVKVPNVIIDNVCADLVITDKMSFYCPTDITATNVTLGRELKAGYNTVCLPFTLKNDYFGTDGLVCTYDKETTEKFWFNIVAADNVVDANTPALVYLKSAKNLVLSSVSVAATPASQLVNYEGATDDASEAVGFLKNVTADDIRGASNSYKVYGLINSGSTLADATFSPAGTATFGACRMVIKSKIATKSGAPLMARGIAIVDEKGIEVNVGEWSGIEFVDMEASSLEVKGGQGEIIITTDANYGMQTVYALDGKAVATVDVVEGTNTVSVQSGVYVVMGQKVLVK